MDKDSEIALLKKALQREKLARKEAESFMEAKSLELYNSNQKLIKLNESLEQEVEKRTKKIEEKERQFQNLVETATDIIFRIDPLGHFTYINPVTEKVSGYSKNDLIGMNFVHLVRPDYREKLISHFLKQIADQQETTSIEFPVVTKEGDEYWLNQKTTLIIENDQPKEFTALARDITDVKKANEALKLSEEKYRGMIESLELGILEVDNDDKIIKAYPQFCKLTGYDDHELVGKSPSEMLLNEKAKKIMDEQNELRVKGETSVYEVPLIKKTGEVVWVIISGAPFYDADKNLIGTIGVHLDISQRRKIEEELLEAKQKAEHSSKAKEQFLANMSHEIRTPLNGVDGMTRLLEDTELTEQQKEYISAIRTSTDNLLIIINDILDISKIEAGKLTIEEIGFYFKKHLLQSVKSIKYKAEEKGILLNTEIDDDIAEILIGDPTRLHQVIVNLLSNAIKFTHKGSVSLKCSLISKTSKSNSVKFEIEDTGIGIEQHKLATIFDSFSQEDETTTRKYGGTGLGLSISKELVDLLNGNLEVISRKNIGTKFYFTIEFKIGTEKDLVEEKAIVGLPESLEGKRVLLVEDNDINQFLATTLLKKWKLNVEVADNGKIAVEKIKKESFDVVLMDMQMPVMGGIEATLIIRKELKLTTPIIALTAGATKGIDKECLNAGMNDYVAKPFNHSELFNKILKVINDGKTL